MHYGILGITTARQDDGTQVPLGGARLRALLAALVLRQGRPVPAELLVEEVWGADQPQDASAALQTLVGRLRRTIGRDEIGSGPAGYWLTGRASDLGDFQRLAAEGRQALETGQPALAAERLGAALALWRGPALADLPDQAGAATRLEGQRDEARRHRISAELALGRAVEVTAELAELCELQPLDEQLQVLLIRALQGGGRTADALRQFETARRVLVEELGADPGPELRAIHQELLHTPEAPSRPETPRSVGNLRPRLTSFVGRDSDLAALAKALSAGRLTTLTGPGGSGKTRLSVEAGRLEQGTGAWPDGVWAVELAPLDDPGAVPGAVFSALGLRETVLHTGGTVAEVARIDDPVRRVVEHCAHRRMLLVLDNCEHLIQAAADFADQLLAECPGVTVLATSREPLGVPGEVVVPVEPLPDPVALRLFAERGAAARPGFDPAADQAACAEICRRLDGLPLAIELAAARLRGMTPRQIADRLDGRFTLLTAGSRTLLPRQQTLRAVVDWSWELLGRRERAVLRRLSVFQGGCTLEAAEQVCADEAGVPREEVADLLLSLVDKSLLVAGFGAEPRYWMLETIHEYATERLAEAAEQTAAHRHTDCFRELVREAERCLHGAEQLHWLAVLEREQDNVRAALRRAVDGGHEQDALVLVLGMSWYWSLRDFRREALGWYDAVAELGPNGFADDAPAPVPLLAGPLEAPLPMPPEQLEEARRQLQLLRMVSLFASNTELLGNSDAAELARRVTSTYTPDLPQAYRFPSLLRVFAGFLVGEMDQLREMLDDAVVGCRVHGRDTDLAFILQIRSRLLNDWVGAAEQAVADGAEALEIFTRVGDRWGMSEALAALAENAAKCGRAEFARDAYRRAIVLAEELGSWQEVPMLQVRLGETMFESDPEEGERLVREALDGVGWGHHRAAEGAVMFGRLALCSLHAWRGEYPEALGQLDELEHAQDSFGPIVPGVFVGIVSCIRGWVYAMSGDAREGVELLRSGRQQIRFVGGAATVFAEHVMVMLVLPAVGVLTALAAQEGELRQARRAARLLGAHGTLHGQLGTFLERREREEAERVLLGLLGEEAFAEAKAEGGRLSVSETAALLDDPEGL
ncbi:BTAD domain-containing putative transcriptional regulator [Kitasatospora sp. McL0602]|uniref:BTAD domain-containing putative transcriptional regulator n=1 Tax=Kitasatospora sp. McL0602 TaxID=3439530 RepID=UPI003F8A530D